MQVARRIAEVREAVAAARSAGGSVGFVPTMGALHAGHLYLLDTAAAECDFRVVSIFVNPTQFGPGEDLAAYPRTPEADLAACREHGTDLLFTPSVEEMYPGGEPETVVSVPNLGARLCGANRPTHFAGVCTVVTKLLNIVQPDRAYFGRKDFQQAVIIRRMVEDLNVPVEIRTCPTVREPDGLAMSSRNAYLSPEQRRQAPVLHAVLEEAAERIRRDHPPAARVREAIRRKIEVEAPLGEIDYVEIVDPWTLRNVEQTHRPVLIALAVRFGRARLIDNTTVDAPGSRA